MPGEQPTASDKRWYNFGVALLIMFVLASFATAV